MFQLLQEAAAATEAAAPTVDVNTPPGDWVRPMGGSRKTWSNVFKNKQVPARPPCHLTLTVPGACAGASGWGFMMRALLMCQLLRQGPIHVPFMFACPLLHPP